MTIHTWDFKITWRQAEAFSFPTKAELMTRGTKPPVNCRRSVFVPSPSIETLNGLREALSTIGAKPKLYGRFQLQVGSYTTKRDRIGIRFVFDKEDHLSLFAFYAL